LLINTFVALSEYKEAKINSLNLHSSILPNHIHAPFLSKPISPNGVHHTEYSMLQDHGFMGHHNGVHPRYSSAVAPDLGNA